MRMLTFVPQKWVRVCAPGPKCSKEAYKIFIGILCHTYEHINVQKTDTDRYAVNGEKYTEKRFVCYYYYII